MDWIFLKKVFRFLKLFLPLKSKKMTLKKKKLLKNTFKIIKTKKSGRFKNMNLDMYLYFRTFILSLYKTSDWFSAKNGYNSSLFSLLLPLKGAGWIVWHKKTNLENLVNKTLLVKKFYAMYDSRKFGIFNRTLKELDTC